MSLYNFIHFIRYFLPHKCILGSYAHSINSIICLFHFYHRKITGRKTGVGATAEPTAEKTNRSPHLSSGEQAVSGKNMPMWLRRALTCHVPAQKTADNQDMTSPLPVYSAWLKCHAQVNGVNHRAARSKKAKGEKDEKIKSVQSIDGKCDISKSRRCTEADRWRQRRTGEGRRMCTWCNGQKHQSFTWSHFPFFLPSQSEETKGHNSGKMEDDCEDGVTAVALRQQLPWWPLVRQ